MNEDSADNPTFLNPLKINVYEVPSRPGKIVINQRIRSHSDEELNEVMGMIRQGHDVYYQLRDRYGISIPDFDYEVGDRNRGYATLYTYVDKIEGGNIADTSLPQESKEKLDVFYKTMIDYYLDVYQNGGNYWADFRNDQLVYGHKVGEGNNEVYVVDLDSSNIAIGNYDTANKAVYNERLFEQLFSVAYSITKQKVKYLINLICRQQEQNC